MDDKEVGRLWDENADVWTMLTRMGYNVMRDMLNTPAFLEMLPDVGGLKGLDVGCGEGSDSRLIAKRCAKLVAVDISEKMIQHSRELEEGAPLGIEYQVASALSLPYPEGSFDFAVSTMCLMDVPKPEQALEEICRVLKPGSFFQFSITHPCFDTPTRKWVDDDEGRHVALQVSDYFANVDGRIEEWIFFMTPPELKTKLRNFRVPRFKRTLSEWMNALADVGFVVERLVEPRASDELVKREPYLADTQLIPQFLIVRCRKPA